MEVRKFDSGATKSSASGKPDYEGFLSPLVIKRYGEYMVKHQLQPDGNLRDSDNWQKGIPKNDYMKSMYRHFMDLWLHHRGYGNIAVEDLEESLTALYFNVQGYLHETLKDKHAEKGTGVLRSI